MSIKIYKLECRFILNIIKNKVILFRKMSNTIDNIIKNSQLTMDNSQLTFNYLKLITKIFCIDLS
ncbi:hypothetical protein UT300019_34140 [Clostridium sp. CTA-19]